MGERNKVLKRYLSNNNRFKSDNPDYGRAFLLNAALAYMSIICMIFGILNIIKTDHPVFIYFYFAVMILSVVVIIFFHKTDNIQLTSVFAVILATFLMGSILHLVYSDYSGLFWAAAYLPFVYLMLEGKKGVRATLILGLSGLLYIIFFHGDWQPAVFSYMSIINISGAGACLMLLIVYYERSQKRAEKSLVIKNNQLHLMSITDRLTGLYNRHKLDETLNELVHKSKTCKKPFSIIIADIDRFKSINDTYGHMTGDKVLVEISNLLLACVRQTDIAGRWGGEEFLIICPDTDYAGITDIAKRIEAFISGYNFGCCQGVALSCGVATHNSGETVDSLLQRADISMYQTKQSRRKNI
ncbi:MAG TPA: GGDEF domain-containing protein [Clostridia bacterium]|nr:GGDEF domain-containing protein [Clostridia bacterium]HPL09049.1 GGDEF domain-containing protein [Clostridia bacterium]